MLKYLKGFKNLGRKRSNHVVANCAHGVNVGDGGGGLWVCSQTSTLEKLNFHLFHGKLKICNENFYSMRQTIIFYLSPL